MRLGWLGEQAYIDTLLSTDPVTDGSVINTPSAAMFDQYLAASKNVTLTPTVRIDYAILLL